MRRRRAQGDGDQPRYHIGVAAEMIGVHAQTLRYYERLKLVEPKRSKGGIRLYSQRDIERLKKIKSLIDLGVNLAGVEVVLRMADTMAEMEQAMAGMQQEMERTSTALTSEAEKAIEAQYSEVDN